MTLDDKNTISESIIVRQFEDAILHTKLHII